MLPDFYIGYEDRMPPSLARTMRGVILALVVALAGLAIVFATGFRPLPASRFEFGRTRQFEGQLRERPYPHLWTATRDASSATRSVLLVAPGKHGAAPLTAGFDGARVVLEGTLAERDGRGLVEIVPRSLKRVSGGSAGGEEPRRLGWQRLDGEIVDSKCYLGVMNPGERKVHRDCAVRCILGGLPPALVVRSPGKPDTMLLLTDEAGGPMSAGVARWAGTPVRIEGDVIAEGDRLYLRTSPARIAAQP